MDACSSLGRDAQPCDGLADDPRHVHLGDADDRADLDRKSTRLNSSHANISYAVFCLKKKTATMFFFNDTATTEIYTLSLHDALPIWLDVERPEVPVLHGRGP